MATSYAWSGFGEDPNAPSATSPPGGNAYFSQPNFGTNQLPGQGSGIGTQPTFSPNELPNQSHSPEGSGAAPGAYSDTGRAFGQPKLGGDKYNPSAKPPTPEAPLAGPGYREDWYKTYGKDLMDTPSSSEDLYAKGAEGSNPFYNYAQEQVTKAINDASAARGNFNSSYTMKNIGNAIADLRGQQAHELGQLAGQADASKFGRYDRGERYAGSAQDAMEGRANAGFDRDLKLREGQSRLVSDFYGNAGKAEVEVLKEKIQAELKAAGLDQARADKYMAWFMNLIGAGAKAYGGGG